MIAQILAPEQITVAPGAEFLTDLADASEATHRFLVTLVNGTDEKLVDLLTIGGGFAQVAQAIRTQYNATWKIHESLSTWEAAF
jgi:hypothetical protein